MNIFRYEMDSDGEDAKQVKDSLVNIGQIIKSGSYPVDGSVIFTDYYASSDKYYRYYVRYKTSSGYENSQPTDTVRPSKANSEKEIAVNEEKLYHPVNAKESRIPIFYDEKIQALVIAPGILTLPQTHESTEENLQYFSLSVALSNGSKTQLFEFTKGTEDDTYTILLHTSLPDVFKGCALKATALVGQDFASKKKGETVIFTNYYWTKPIEEDMLVILSTDEKPQKLNSITVPSTTSNSTPIDYARTADYSSRN